MRKLAHVTVCCGFCFTRRNNYLSSQCLTHSKKTCTHRRTPARCRFKNTASQCSRGADHASAYLPASFTWHATSRQKWVAARGCIRLGFTNTKLWMQPRLAGTRCELRVCTHNGVCPLTGASTESGFARRGLASTSLGCKGSTNTPKAGCGR